MLLDLLVLDVGVACNLTQDWGSRNLVNKAEMSWEKRDRASREYAAIPAKYKDKPNKTCTVSLTVKSESVEFIRY